MQKQKTVIAACITIVLAFCASFSAEADSNLQNLSQCRRIFAYSGYDNAYFYGYDNHMLCSAHVIPDEMEQTVTTDGIIRAVCHDETSAYALMTTANAKYNLIRLEMNSGEYTISPIAFGSEINHDSFAVADGEVFLMVQDATYGHVESHDFAGNRMYTYYPDNGVNYLFHNGGNAYAVSYSGEIFYLSNGNCSSCAKIEAYSECQNAGIGYIRTDSGQLVSLNGGMNRNSNAVQAVISDGELISSDFGLLLVAVNHFQACLNDNYRCIVNRLETSEISPEISAGADHTEDTVVVVAGMTVAALKKGDKSIGMVYDNDGKEISSGKLRTGYSLRKNSVEYPLAVYGDLNASGTVNSRDIKLFMNHLVGNTTINGVFAVAADMNSDGKLDNRDLVLLSKTVNNQRQ